ARVWTERRRWRAAVALVVLVTATALTLSRAAWLGIAAGLAVAAALLVRAAPPRHVLRQALAIALVTMAVAGALVAGGRGAQLAARFRELVAPLGGSGASRLEIWRIALGAWRARPIAGHGPDTFGLVFPRHQTPAYWRYEWGGLAV